MSNLDKAYEEAVREANAEPLAERLERLKEKRVAWRSDSLNISEARMKLLEEANPLVANDEIFVKLAASVRISKNPTVTLPAHRYEGLSRGRGWARKGKGRSAVWGERCEGGYKVGPGNWEFGGHDGFNRKGSIHWEVEAVPVGQETWLVAN